MEWNMGFQTIVKGSPPGPSSDESAGEGSLPDKEAICVEEGQLSLWSKLGNTKPKKKLALADMRAMVCTVGLNIFGDFGLQKDVMEKLNWL